MATTSIWSVKGWLGKVLIYVENPEKTENPDCVNDIEITERNKQSLDDVIAYAVNTEKTRLQNDKTIADEGEVIMQQYVSGINCSPLTARAEMMAVKKRFGKEDGIMAFHGYQSFAQGECTPDMAHEIGKKLAEELWGNRYQVIVATHLDKESHLHNHFVVNSISFVDGKRFFRSNQDYRDMRQASDRLCKEYGLRMMNRKEILAQVLEIVAMSYKTDVNKLSENTSFKEDLSGASVQMVALVSEIENELDVALMLADASACTTIGDLINLIEEEM